jgi:hypothetical protein
MKRPLLTAVATTALAAGLLAVSATPAIAADTTISTGTCVLVSGGQVTVPAGSTIFVRYGDADVSRGMVTDWLQAQTTTLTLNGGVPIDVSGLFGPPTQRPAGDWVSVLSYPTGITLTNPGDSLTFTVTTTLSHLFAEEFNGPVGFEAGYEPGPPFFSGPGVYFTGTCTVTAV